MNMFSKPKLIRLFGVGGNLKTSIINHKRFKNFTKIPEFNREATELLEENFKERITTAVNLVSKYILVRTLVESGTKRIITDRSLIDYGIINEIIKNHLPDYFGAYNEDLRIEDAAIFEHNAYKDFKGKIVNVLLVTKDLNFLRNIIDNSWDERAKFYDNVNTYLHCQEFYKEQILKYFPDVHIIELDDMSNIPNVVNKITKEINDL